MQLAEAAAGDFIGRVFGTIDAAKALGITNPRVHRGLIVTGDQFVRDDRRSELTGALPGALCVEMEGGAIAQVCHLNGLPFVIVRVISDNADSDAAVDFKRFVETVAPAYAVGIVSLLLASLE